MISWSHPLETKPCDRIWQVVWHVQERWDFCKLFLSGCSKTLTGDFHLKNFLLTTILEAWPCLLIFRAEYKTHLLTLSFYFNTYWSLLSLSCFLIWSHYSVFVLYGEAYHKECKGNDLCTKRYAYAHQNKLSLEGSAKTIPSTSLGEYWENF